MVLQVNKADQIEATEGLSSEETKQYVADLVTRQLEGDGFRLEPDQVGSAAHSRTSAFWAGSAWHAITFKCSPVVQICTLDELAVWAGGLAVRAVLICWCTDLCTAKGSDEGQGYSQRTAERLCGLSGRFVV